MAQVLLVSPSVATVRLTEALRRLLLRRGHRVRAVTPNRAIQRCGAHQLTELELVKPDRRLRTDSLDALAVRELRQHGEAEPSDRMRVRARRRLERYVAPFRRLLDEELPEIVVFCGDRSASARLFAQMARDHDASVLHLGEGLLPGTVQWDPEGLDGDSTACRRTAAFYRSQPRDPMLLHSALAHSLAIGKHGADRRLIGPTREELMLLKARTMFSSGERLDGAAVSSWQRFAARNIRESMRPMDLPKSPYVLALRQRDDDLRVRIDAPFSSFDSEMFLHAAERALESIDQNLKLVVLDPPTHRPSSVPLLQVLLPAAAVLTVNHPASMTALLAGTPVVHLGRAPWAIRSVCQRANEPGDLGEALDRALNQPRDNLRERMLTHLLRVDHVWCDPVEPAPQGASGIVQEIERLADRARPDPVPLEEYEPGPIGPLRLGEE